MTEEAVKKIKKTLPPPDGGGIKETRPSPEQIMGMEEAGKQFFEKLQKTPGKLEGLMEKVATLDIDDVLEKLTSPPGSVSNDPIIRVIQEDILLLSEALFEVDNRLKETEKWIAKKVEEWEQNTSMSD